MLNVTIDLNDFFMIGDDIRVQYRKNGTGGRVLVNVQVPEGVKIVHSADADKEE